MSSIPEICFEVAHWNNGEKYQRVIVCAANRYTLNSGETLVIPSARHYDRGHCLILDNIPELKSTQVYGDNQGFIDQYNNY